MYKINLRIYNYYQEENTEEKKEEDIPRLYYGDIEILV